MRRTRVIPVLLIHNCGLYKSVKFKKPVYIGDPINAIKLFNDMAVDEIMVLDTDASKEGRGPIFSMIEEMASEAFMPFSYGGGVSSLEEARTILRIGVEKVVFNYRVLKNKNILTQCSSEFGRQSVVAIIDVKRNLFGKTRVYDHVSGKCTKLDVFDHAQNLAAQGAGEIVINSVDNDGLLAGYDLELIAKIVAVLDIPVVACGGAGALDHFSEARKAGASAVAAGSFFVYQSKQKGVLINYPQEKILRQYLD